jgi:hypothetical protein
MLDALMELEHDEFELDGGARPGLGGDLGSSSTSLATNVTNSTTMSSDEMLAGSTQRFGGYGVGVGHGDEDGDHMMVDVTSGVSNAPARNGHAYINNFHDHRGFQFTTEGTWDHRDVAVAAIQRATSSNPSTTSTTTTIFNSSSSTTSTSTSTSTTTSSSFSYSSSKASSSSLQVTKRQVLTFGPPPDAPPSTHQSFTIDKDPNDMNWAVTLPIIVVETVDSVSSSNDSLKTNGLGVGGGFRMSVTSVNADEDLWDHAHNENPLGGERRRVPTAIPKTAMPPRFVS